MTSTNTAGSATDIREFGHELWSYLTGKEAVIEYSFTDMVIEVPQRTGADSPRATWKLNGTVRVRTADQDNPGALGSAARNGTS